MTLSITRKMIPIALGLTTLVFAGCHKGPDYTKVDAAWKTGNTQVASQEILANATPENINKYDERIRWMLNAGSITNLNGEYAKSAECLKQAQAYIDEGSRKEDDNKSVGTQISNFVTGAFEPTMQEYVMIPVIQLYNAFGVDGDVAGKASDIRKAHADMLELKRDTLFQSMKDEADVASFGIADEKYLKPLEIAGIKVESVSIDFNKEIRENKAIARKIYGEDKYKVKPSEEKIKAVYSNPFAFWLSGMVSLLVSENPKGEIGNTIRTIRDASRLNKGLGISNPMLEKLELNLNEAQAATHSAGVFQSLFGKESPAYTYVIYEGGKAPAIGVQSGKIKVPLAVNAAISAIVVGASNIGAKNTEMHVFSTEYSLAACAALPTEATAYFPVIASHGKAPELTVNGVKPTLFVDYNPILEERLALEADQTLKNATWNAAKKIALRGAGIAASLVALNKAIDDNNAWLINSALLSYEASVANAAQPLELDKPDTRTWAYLPRTISVAELQTPENGQIDIAGESVQVPTEGVNFVRVYKASKSFPATVQVFTITPKGRILASPISRLPATQGADNNANAKQ